MDKDFNLNSLPLFIWTFSFRVACSFYLAIKVSNIPLFRVIYCYAAVQYGKLNGKVAEFRIITIIRLIKRKALPW